MMKVPSLVVAFLTAVVCVSIATAADGATLQEILENGVRAGLRPVVDTDAISTAIATLQSQVPLGDSDDAQWQSESELLRTSTVVWNPSKSPERKPVSWRLLRSLFTNRE